jgi:hypothetical protein
VTDKRKAPACRELGLGGGNRKSISNCKILFPPPKSKRFQSFFGENKVSSESKSALRQIVEKQHPELFWDPSDPTRTRLSAKVVHLMAPESKRRKPPHRQEISVSVPKHLWDSRAFRALDEYEKVIMFAILAKAREFGTDRPIIFSARMGEPYGIGRTRTAQALAGIHECGFIVEEGKPRRGKNTGVAATWRVTCLPFQGNPPTYDYQRIFYKNADLKAAEKVRGEPWEAPLSVRTRGR